MFDDQRLTIIFFSVLRTFSNLLKNCTLKCTVSITYPELAQIQFSLKMIENGIIEANSNGLTLIKI